MYVSVYMCVSMYMCVCMFVGGCMYVCVIFNFHDQYFIIFTSEIFHLWLNIF